MGYLWISSTICLKFECESLAGEEAVAANAESLANSRLSSLAILSVGFENDIKSVSLVFDWLRLGFRCVLDGGGANDPLLDDVGNDFPLLNNDVDGELPNEPGRGRVINWFDLMLTDDKLFCAEIIDKAFHEFRSVF